MGNIINFEKVMNAAMTMPGVQVDRIAFLISTFKPFGNDVLALVDAKPSELYSKDVLDKVADDIIKNHTLKVTAVSAVAGLPGGLAMLGTIPGDLAQFYWHFLVLAQKLAYVYGWPDLRDENNNLGEGAQGVLTLFVGVGLGVGGVQNGLDIVVRAAADHWAKKIPRMALMKTSWYPILKKILSFIGIKISRETVGKSASKIIPLIGGLISGSMTYLSFKPMAKKLKKTLESTALMNVGK